jgi:hypothetical protein
MGDTPVFVAGVPAPCAVAVSLALSDGACDPVSMGW